MSQKPSPNEDKQATFGTHQSVPAKQADFGNDFMEEGDEDMLSEFISASAPSRTASGAHYQQ